MTHGDPEQELDPLMPRRAVFTAVAPPGQREMSLYPACCQCGRERDDLADFFYADPPS